MTNVAIVGGTGFIGRHAMSAFSRAGRTAVAFSRGTVDYTNVDALAVAFKGMNSVVHIAGLAHLPAKSLRDAEKAFVAANVHVAVNVARAALRAGVERFVLLSSAGVFGAVSPPGGFDDSTEPRPYDAYTASKFEGEKAVSEILSGHIGVSILRPPMVYGPHAPGSFRRLTEWVTRGLPLPVGKISARRSFIGVRNLCSALVAAECASQAGARPMIVSDEEPLSVGDFARAVARVSGRRFPVISVPPRLLKFGLQIAGMSDEYRRIALPFELRTSLIHSVLNWRAPYSLIEELRWAQTAE
jgi:nucleoside-diphosphate-sugar epimerase